MTKDTRIQQPYTLAEIKTKIASHDYSAELLLQHAMLLLEKPAAVTVPEEQNESAYQRGYMDGMAKGRRDAEAAPQQESQEPVAWQGVHDQTDLYYTKPAQADVRPLYTAPQPAPAAQGDAPTDSGPISRQWLTVVYRGVEAGDEVQQICTHPKVSAMSWSHALHDRDAARSQAATAAQGDAEDAARYRCIRRGQHWSVIDGTGNELRAEALDTAIDAAMNRGDAARKQGANHD